MAIFPCAFGLHRYVGPQRSAYFSLAHDQDANSWKLRLCPQHVASIQDDLSHFEFDPVDEAASAAGPSVNCVTCLQPVDESGWQFFATSYPSNNQRKDYWGKLHVNCSLPSEWTSNKVVRA